MKRRGVRKDEGQPPSRKRGIEAEFQRGESREGLENQRLRVDVTREAEGVQQNCFGLRLVARAEATLTLLAT